MCESGDGATVDEVRFHVHGTIARHGWSSVGVESDGDRPPWAYTIGLIAGFHHPELVVVGLEDLSGAGLLNAIGEHIRDGERFRPGEGLELTDGSTALLLEVDPVHFTGNVFAQWVDHYACLGPPVPAPAAVQVWLPQICPVRLDGPTEVLGAGARNRAARTETRWRPRRWPEPAPG